MKLLRGRSVINQLDTGVALTIGNFDGLHRGHQALLASLRNNAQRLGLPTLVVFFEPQPLEYFQGQSGCLRLMRRRDKLDWLRFYGIDYVYCLVFNQTMASMSAVAFAKQYIFSLFKARFLLIGDDFRFGQGRTGTPDLLRSMGEQYGCAVQTCDDYLHSGQRVSSTLIRRALLASDLSAAADLLGRLYSTSGRVVTGDGRGRQWGFPTANLSVPAYSMPLRGVFCVQVIVPSMGKTYFGVANVGMRPTVGTDPSLRVEVHVFDFEGSLYHERLTVYFLHRLRDEAKFESFDALIKQIQADVVLAKAYFNRVLVNDRL